MTRFEEPPAPFDQLRRSEQTLRNDKLRKNLSMAQKKSLETSSSQFAEKSKPAIPLPRLLISLATHDPAGEIRVPLEAFLHFSNEIAFDLEELEEDLQSKHRKRGLAGAKLGATTLKLLF